MTEKKNLAVIASRLKCVDAVSVEAERWIDKYAKLNYNVHLLAGKFGEPVSMPHFELPEMNYENPEVRGIKRIIFGAKLDKEGRKAAIILLNNLINRIKGPLKNYLVKNHISVLSIEDALLSQKNLPLALAVSQIVNELRLPTISRYHYLPWDTTYFTKFDNLPKVLSVIPPVGKNIVHVTNNSASKAMLSEKKNIISRVIPNTVDLDKVRKFDDYNSDFRKELGIKDDQLIFLQPTRVKRNKSVERSIKLVAEINDIMKKDNVLILTGSPVYSRGNYFEEIVRRINKQNVKVIFANDRIFLDRHQNPNKKFYSIHDAYVHADIVLYPNTSNAFGNPIIEAAAYKKPVIVNNFPNLKDFMDKGFKFVVMDQKVDAGLVSDTYELLVNKQKMDDMVNNNFELVKKHYSSEVLDDALMPILNEIDVEEQPRQNIFTKVTGLIWHKSSHPVPQKEVRKTVQVNIQIKHVKKSSKGNGLMNKKGGYKEPMKDEQKK